MKELSVDVDLVSRMVDEMVAARSGPRMLEALSALRARARALRQNALAGGRDALAADTRALSTSELATVAHAQTQRFHLVNAAEEQHRIRTLRERDRDGTAVAGSILDACAELAREGARPDDVRALLARLFVMPVLTAHPTEARRRTVISHLATVSLMLDQLDDPRAGDEERRRAVDELRESVAALYCTDEARAARPSPLDEVRAGLIVFERTLFDVTPRVVRALEDALARTWPGERFEVGAFLQWGTWIGGDRDGNPNVTADVTRAALERHRQLAIARALDDVRALGRELSVSARRVDAAALAPLAASIDEDRARVPQFAGERAGQPWREKLALMAARLEATRVRGDAGYVDAAAYREDLALIGRTLTAAGLPILARGRVRDAERRAEAFGFHLATMDLRQHSGVHEEAVGEILAAGGAPGYAQKSERERVELLTGLLERADVGAPRARAGFSPRTRDLLATLDVVGRARRDQGPQACARYIVSFTSAPSDLLEVLFLVRAARLAPDELRPVPLFEQLADLEGAAATTEKCLHIAPLRAALDGELEVMIGYSDSSKQVGYVASQIALRRAQEALAEVADRRGITLTVFHGRGGAVGRGGGPANRAIRAQPASALRGRLRVTEQGETIAARYGRPEIALRDLEQMVNAVLVGSLEADARRSEPRAFEATLDRAKDAARAAYDALIGDEERIVRYALQATPMREIIELPIASRPASRKAEISFSDLRAIPWVFSWNQSRHGLPGWFGVGTALDAVIAAEGLPRVRELYAIFPFFRALVDNARLALARADIDVAAQYARLADESTRGVFERLRAEHARAFARIADVTDDPQLFGAWPTIASTVERRNPDVDVLSHAQIELLRRLRETTDGAERARVREALFVTINGIAAGLMTAG